MQQRAVIRRAMRRSVVYASFRTAAIGFLAGLAACAGRAVQSDPAPGGSNGGAAATVNVVSYNIRHGRGMDDRVDIARTAAVVRELAPDIVGLQEVDVGVERSGRINEPEEMGQLLGMKHAFGSFFDYQGGQYGMAILSRFPVLRSESIRLPDGNEPRVALAVEIDHPAIGRLMVVNVHFDWVADDGFRFAQATRLTTFLDSLTIPFILLGDFNDTPGSRTLALFTQRAFEARKPADDHLTFSSTKPEKEIDFIFGSPAARWSASSVRVITEPVASDHRPVTAVLAFAPPAR